MPREQANVEVAITRLGGCEDLPLPAYQSEHAAGMDLHAAVPTATPVTLQPGDIAAIPCGIAIAIPPGYEGQVRPRSGLATRHGISIPNSPGTIDADYRGQVTVALVNLGRAAFTVTRGMRIAQLVIQPVPRVVWKQVAILSATSRGDGGFGHSGH